MNTFAFILQLSSHIPEASCLRSRPSTTTHILNPGPRAVFKITTLKTHFWAEVTKARNVDLYAQLKRKIPFDSDLKGTFFIFRRIFSNLLLKGKDAFLFQFCKVQLPNPFFSQAPAIHSAKPTYTLHCLYIRVYILYTQLFLIQPEVTKILN